MLSSFESIESIHNMITHLRQLGSIAYLIGSYIPIRSLLVVDLTDKKQHNPNNDDNNSNKYSYYKIMVFFFVCMVTVGVMLYYQVLLPVCYVYVAYCLAVVVLAIWIMNASRVRITPLYNRDEPQQLHYEFQTEKTSDRFNLDRMFSTTPTHTDSVPIPFPASGSSPVVCRNPRCPHPVVTHRDAADLTTLVASHRIQWTAPLQFGEITAQMRELTMKSDFGEQVLFLDVYTCRTCGIVNLDLHLSSQQVNSITLRGKPGGQTVRIPYPVLLSDLLLPTSILRSSCSLYTGFKARYGPDKVAEGEEKVLYKLKKCVRCNESQVFENCAKIQMAGKWGWCMVYERQIVQIFCCAQCKMMYLAHQQSFEIGA
jgi:hypothetical protein